MSEPRQGWRWFCCDECGYRWKAATRDCYSPSKETCPVFMCSMEVSPHMRELDITLPVDDSGNLLS